MKTLLPITAVCAAFLMSCAGSKPLSTEDFKNDTENAQLKNILEGTVSVELISPNKADTAVSSISYTYYKNPKLPYQDAVNRRIQEYIFGSTSLTGFDVPKDTKLSPEIMEQGLDSFEVMYYDEVSLYNKDEYFGGVWSKEIGTSVSEKKEYVLVSMSGWEYTGGAHGSAWSQDDLFDIKTGRELFLADFISDVNAFLTIAELIFRTDQGIDQQTSLNDAGFWFENDAFTVSQNFSFSENSMDFVYNQYEIGPYSAGIITLNIPMEKIKHLVTRRVD